jgi:REP element-mobilizing transposase RayT
MAVYHFTLHAYRSWTPAHPRGYVRRGKGILPTDKKMADAYARAAKQPPVVFTKQIQKILIDTARAECAAKNWRLHCAATDSTHVHLLVSWKTFIPWNNVIHRLKNILSYRLGRELATPGRQWFVRGESRRRVRNRDHLQYLIQKYLPSHGGLTWTAPKPVARIR